MPIYKIIIPKDKNKPVRGEGIDFPDDSCSIITDKLAKILGGEIVSREKKEPMKGAMRQKDKDKLSMQGE